MSVNTAVRHTTEHGPRTTAGPNMAILHHAATTNLGVIEALMAPGGRVVSANKAIKNKDIIEKVPDNRRGFSVANAYWDSRAITAECANESVQGWTISDESHESLAQMVADSARRHKWYPHRNGDPKTWTVIGHREVYTIHGAGYATACPGGMNLNWITARAQEILGAEPPKDVAPAQPPATGQKYPGTWGGYDVATIQRLLTARGFPTLIDDQYGPDTVAQVKAFQKSRKIKADGDVGPITWAELNKVPAKPTPAAPAPSTRPQIRRGSKGVHVEYLQRKLRTVYPLYAGRLVIDGDFGPATEAAVREFQRRSGLFVDGIVGPNTWAKLR